MPARGVYLKPLPRYLLRVCIYLCIYLSLSLSLYLYLHLYLKRDTQVVTCSLSDDSCKSATLGHVAFNGPGLLKAFSQYSVEVTIVLIQVFVSVCLSVCVCILYRNRALWRCHAVRWCVFIKGHIIAQCGRVVTLLFWSKLSRTPLMIRHDKGHTHTITR